MIAWEKRFSESEASRILKEDLKPRRCEWRRRMRWAMEWKVPPQNLWGGMPVSEWTRSSISVAALLVKVRRRISQGAIF